METLHISGGHPLSGTVEIHGAKNAALPILAAAAAIPGRFALHSCPDIRDVEITREILSLLGVSSRRSGGDLYLDSTGLRPAAIPPSLAGRLRSSVLFLGALLCSTGSAVIPLPGGCVLGPRPLDLHLSALEALGAETDTHNGGISCRGRLRGGTVILRYPSVGATENLLLAALNAEAPVRILGAAKEPEIADLAAFLSACGARITGAGSPCVTIRPGTLHGGAHRILPDRIEAATWLCAVACAGGALTLDDLQPEQLQPVSAALRAAGCRITEAAHTMTIEAGPLQAVPPIVTGPYPAFPTDAQAPLMAALLRAAGTTLIQETVFEDRFRHVPALRAMGGEIEAAGRLARIRGVPRLHGARVRATDLRGAAAMLCAALGAEGQTVLTNAELLGRGYQDLTQTLNRVGAVITADTT